MYLTAFAILCPLLALLTHEMMHIAVARRHGPVSLNLLSVFPRFRLYMLTPGESSARGTQLMSAAPLIVGVCIVGISIWSGLWQHSDLYYIQGIVIAIWAAYSHPSPAGLQTILNPHQNIAS